MLNISRIGNLVKIVLAGANDTYYVELRNISLTYNATDNVIFVSWSVRGAAYNYKFPIASVTINGVVITNQTVFDTQAATLLLTASENVDVILGTLTAAATSGVFPDQTNKSAKGIQFVVDVTAITGTAPSIVVTLQGKDLASGKYYTLLTSAVLSATGTTVLNLYPGIVASAGVAANSSLPRTWRVIYTVAGTTPAITATIGASVVI